MALSLRARLDAMAKSAAPAPQVSAGLFEYEHTSPAPAGIFDLDGEGLSRMAGPVGFDPRKALFIDTETTGLRTGAGTVAFLVGLGRLEGDGFVVRQYMMQSYASEPLLMDRITSFARDAAFLVSYNGRTFDIPLLSSRFVMCRMADPLKDLPHMDLIYPARRAWKLRLKDCSLGKIEQVALNFHRQGDLPGSEAPARFFDYLKTGDAAPLEEVVRHNRQDIISLAALLVKLNQVYAQPTHQTSMLDVYSLGRAMDRQGDRETARTCYRLAGSERPLSTMERLRERQIAGPANRHLSLMLRREGDYTQAQTLWQDMIHRGQMGAFPYIELAKLCEHRLHDLPQALRLTEEALPLARDEAEKQALLKRQARLAEKMERS